MLGMLNDAPTKQRGGADNPATVRQRPSSVSRLHVHTRSSHERKHTHELSAHIRSIMCLETHTKMQMHTWPINSLWGHQSRLSAMTPLRVREGVRWALEEAEREMEGPWTFTECSPGSAPIISVCLHCQSPTASPWSARAPKETGLPLLLLGRKKSFDESLVKCLSHPALALDNDIPPAIAKSCGAEDKCHFQLSVMWSAFDYIILMVVRVSNYILSFLIRPVITMLLLRLGWLLPGYRMSTLSNFN